MAGGGYTIPKRVLQAVRERNCVLYAGAGFSLEAELPDSGRLATGGGLAFRLAKELYEQGHFAKEPQPDEPLDFASLAEDYATAFGRHELILLLHAIYAPDKLTPAEAHHTAIKWFPSIITTNYDALFEAASYMQGKRPHVITRDPQMPFAGAGDRPAIYKVHGDLNDPQRIVITSEDYRRTPLPDGLREKLASFLSEKTVLFIGCGLADSDLQEVYFQVLDRLGDLKPRAFVVTPFPADDLPERKAWDLFRKRWEQRGMEFINSRAGEFMALLDAALSDQPAETVTAAPPARTRDLESLLADYQESLRHRVGTVRIVGEERSHPLKKVFVELNIVQEYKRPRVEWASADVVWPEMLERQFMLSASEPRAPGERPDEEKARRTVKPDELLRRRTRAIVVGQPGFGKTTLLKYLALNTLETARLPGFLELKTLVEEDFKAPHCALADLLFDKAVEPFMQLDAAEREQLKSAFLARVKAGEAAIFLDGLDEVRGASFFDRLCEMVNQFLHSLHDNAVLVIATRPHALGTRFGEMKELEIAPLNPRQVEAFVKHYHGDDAAARRFLQSLRRSGGLRELARVPLLLGVISELYRTEKIVVEERLKLYQQIVLRLAVQLDKEKTLAHSRFKIADMDGKLKLDFLSALACERMLIDEVKASDAAGETARLIFTGDELVKKAKQFVTKNKLSSHINPYWLADDVKATPLLREVASDVYAFTHFTLQEYLAAKSLAGRDNCETILCRNYFNPAIVEWEVLPMALGLVDGPDALYAALEALSESLTYTNLRLRVRGLGFSAGISEQRLAALTDRLIEFLIDSDSEGQPYSEFITRALSALSGRSMAFITARLGSFLTHKDNSVRRSATAVLGEIGSEQAVAALLAVFQKKDEGRDLRQEAAKALGKIGDEQTVAALLTALKDEVDEVRWSAADALGEIGSEQAVPALLVALWDSNWAMQEAAADALGKIGSERAVSALHMALRHKNGHLRGTAASALGRIGGEQAIAALLEGLNYGDLYVGGSAVEILGKIGGEQIVAALLATLKDKQSFGREDAVKALGKIGGEQAVAALLVALKDNNRDVRRSAVEALGEIGGEQVVAALLAVLKDKDTNVRSSAAKALSEIGSGRTVPILLALLKDKNPYVRRSVVKALGKIGGEQGVAALFAALKDKSNLVRGGAVEALGEIGGEQALAALFAGLKDNDSSVRQHAAEALGKIDGEQAVMALRWALMDKESLVRWEAIEALGKIGNEQAVAALLGVLKKDEDHYARKYAARGLEKIKPHILTSGLLNALAHEGKLARQKAAEVVGYYVESKNLAEELQRLSIEDPAEEVRAAAADAHARYLRKLELFGKTRNSSKRRKR